MTLKELIELSNNVTSFERDNIPQTIMSCSNSYSKWLSYQIEEGLKLSNNLSLLDTEYAKLYKHFRWNWDYEISSRVDIENLIKAEDSYQVINTKLELNRQKLILIEGTLKAINSLSFNIRTFLEFEKIKAGF